RGRRDLRQRASARLQGCRPDRLRRRFSSPRHRLARTRAGERMNAFWSYFWPALGIGLIFGILAGSVAVRVRIVRSRELPHEPTLIPQPRRKRMLLLTGGIGASIIGAVIWHGPLGAADRFATEVERSARLTLNDWEMTQA